MNALERGKRFIRYLTGLRKGTDARSTVASITEGVQIRGANVWMLVCSAVLASIGLNIASSAVIIGAMLISPLMSPILGVGLGTAIYDRALLKDSLKNLALAASLALITSTLFFWLSPIKDITPELSARTTPTLLDVGVAFFGGVAGIVASSRRRATNAIPGVAIATALMPPICTAGFGLANLDSRIFLGSFYLFFINAVFIATATYLIVVTLRFPKKEVPDGETDIQVKRFIIGFAVLTIIPSAFIFYNVLEELRVERGIKQFIEAECRQDDRQALQWEVVRSVQPQQLKVYMVGRELEPGEKLRMQNVLDNYRIGDLQLRTVQLNVSPDEFKRLNADVEKNLAEKISFLEALTEERAGVITELRASIVALERGADPMQRFVTDGLKLFPSLASLEWAEEADPAMQERKVLVMKFYPNVLSDDRADVVRKLRERAEVVLGVDNLTVREVVEGLTSE